MEKRIAISFTRVGFVQPNSCACVQLLITPISQKIFCMKKHEQFNDFSPNKINRISSRKENSFCDAVLSFGSENICFFICHVICYMYISNTVLSFNHFDAQVVSTIEKFQISLILLSFLLILML